MTKRVDHGPIVFAVMREAREKFGPTTDENRGTVARWVQLRVSELTGDTTSKASQPQLFDDEVVVEPSHRPE